MAPEIENRQHPRMPITLPARMVTAIGVMEGETENVSLHGGFIRCQKPLEPGDRLVVIVNFPSKQSFNSYAEVVWSRVPRPNDEGTSPGMGVKFIDLTQTILIGEAQSADEVPSFISDCPEIEQNFCLKNPSVK